MLKKTTETLMNNKQNQLTTRRAFGAGPLTKGLVLGVVSLGIFAGCGSEPRKQERVVEQTTERDANLAAKERELENERARIVREEAESRRRIEEDRARLAREGQWTSDSRNGTHSPYTYRNPQQNYNSTNGTLTNVALQALPFLLNLFTNSGSNQNTTTTNASMQSALLGCGLGSASSELMDLVKEIISRNQYGESAVRPYNSSQILWDEAMSKSMCVLNRLR